jgi:hypothetical protein
MPQFDAYGQQVPYPILADSPDIETAVGPAVESLVPRSVMRFASASVRGATITTPEEGMVTWLKDVNRLEVYDGTAWVAFAAGTSLWTDLVLASGYTDSSGSNNNQGAAQYRVVNLFGEVALMLRGGVSIAYPSGDPANNGYITSTPLPGSARPSVNRTVPVACSAQNSANHALKLDVEPSGHLRLVGNSDTGQDKPPWCSLNGVLVSL